ncbi:MAG: hypothetical protein HYY57_01165, partial [Candidatus Omnitrophica bacterium]|nr:hypothetical protein [Candidatus Omnitrophota bacterium]
DIRDRFRMEQRMVNSTEVVNYQAISPMYHAPFLPPQPELPFGGTANVMGLVSLPVGPVPREAAVMAPTNIHADWRTEEESNYCDDRDPGGSC